MKYNYTGFHVLNTTAWRHGARGCSYTSSLRIHFWIHGLLTALFRIILNKWLQFAVCHKSKLLTWEHMSMSMGTSYYSQI